MGFSDSSEDIEATPANSATYFRGTVTKVTFHNPSTGFAILRATPDAGMNDPNAENDLGTVVGVVSASPQIGTNIVAQGEWQTHPKFGRQFKARFITESEPTGEHAITRYLASGTIRGFGPKLAERVVKHFGEDTIRILDESPERLLEIQGIGEKKLEGIEASWKEKRLAREVLLFFQKHGVSLALAQRIFARYGERSIETVSKNPWILAKDVWRIGFMTADRIARAIGVNPEAPERITAGLAYSLQQAADDGHSFLPEEDLLFRTATLLELNNRELIRSALQEALATSEVISDSEAIYLPALADAERELAESIFERIAPGGQKIPRISDEVVQRILQALHLRGNEPAPPIRFSEQQQAAICLAAERQLLVITGGPGCGKTTVVRAIAALYRSAGLAVRLAAPTGRAAQRLSEVCDMPASTIHRLLGFDPMKRAFVHNSERPLELDVLIVDESSMIDLPLAASLLAAVPQTARIVFVGDADQLPSVGPGLVLAEMLNISEIPRVKLTTLFRRADESSITHIAHQINEGIAPKIPQPDGQTRTDAYFLPVKSAAEAASIVERLVCEQIPKKFGIPSEEITVLTPVNQGALGVISLNQLLQSKLVPPSPSAPSVSIGSLEFRIRDKVCQRVNNYQLHSSGVFNGDQGKVVGIDTESKSVFVKLWDGREIEYTSDSLSQIDLAYALTIHRSQGSEVPAVVLVLHDSHAMMLERQLIYTAVTRAKKLLVVVGTEKALRLASTRARSKRRFSRLHERVTSLLTSNGAPLFNY